MFGGTFKIKVPNDGKLHFCYYCHNYLKRHYYVHQCTPEIHMRCYECLTSTCKRCGKLKTKFIKTYSDLF